MTRFGCNGIGWVMAVVALLAGTATGCDGGGVAGHRDDDCHAGETVACACEGGGTGTRLCEASTCECPGAVLSCSPTALQFPDVPLGATAGAGVICTNAGVGTARIPEPHVVVEGPFTASWREAWPTAGIGVGEVVTLDVGFEGRTVGAAAGSLVIESNAGAVEIALAGNVNTTACELEFPSSLTGDDLFGESREAEVVVRNPSGYLTCAVERIDLCLGTDPAYTLPAGPFENLEVPPNTEFRFAVRLLADPLMCGEMGAGGCVEYRLPEDGRRTTALPCLGSPDIRVAPPGVDFEQVVIGCNSRQRGVELINVTSTPRTFRQAAFMAGTTPEFELTYQPVRGTTIPPGGSVGLGVTYAPVDEGHDGATLLAWIDEQEEPVSAYIAGWSRGPTTITDTWVQGRRPKLDMLVVLDNGTAMGEEAARFAAELGGLPLSLGLQNLDYHLAVTTTSLAPTIGGGCPGGAEGGEDGRFFPVNGVRPRIVSNALPNAESVWVANLGVGACGSAAAQPLEAALRALTEPLATSLDDPRHLEEDDGNLGFLRPDAHLSVLVVSDRDDASPRSPAEYHQALQALKGPRNHDLLSFHTVGGGAAGCTAGDGRSGTAAPRLLDMANRTDGGTAASICGTNWLPPVTWVHDGPRSCFHLGQHPWDRNADGVVSPDDGEVTMRLDGDAVSARTLEGDEVWSYREDQNAVCFSPLTVPEPGTLIEISYAQECIL